MEYFSEEVLNKLNKHSISINPFHRFSEEISASRNKPFVNQEGKFRLWINVQGPVLVCCCCC